MNQKSLKEFFGLNFHIKYLRTSLSKYKTYNPFQNKPIKIFYLIFCILLYQSQFVMYSFTFIVT